VQQHGIGKLLFAALAEGAWQAGVRHWKAVFLVYNTAIRRLLETVGKKQAECGLDCGVVEAVYRLFPWGNSGSLRKRREMSEAVAALHSYSMRSSSPAALITR